MSDQNTQDAWEYRQLAAEHLALAKAVAKNAGDPVALYYALELRRAIEAYAYSLLCTYRPEMSSTDLETWQPHTVMRALKGIDPDADKPLTIQFENTDGSFSDIGTDQRLGYRWLSENYNRLSSIVHVPTVAKMQQARRTASEIREACDAIVADLDFVLAQERWNFVMGVFCTMDCECGFTMRRRAENLEVGGRIVCAMCSRVYVIQAIEDGKVYRLPSWHRFDCKFCGTKNGYQEREGAVDFFARCRNPDCHEPVRFFKAWAYMQPKERGSFPELDAPIALDPDAVLDEPGRRDRS